MYANRTRTVILFSAAVIIASFVSLSAQGADYPPEVKRGVNAIYGKDIQRHIEVLASDAYQGREAGKKGAVLAGNYIAQYFQQLGLLPGGEGGTYFQSFPLGRGGGASEGSLADANTFKVITRKRGEKTRAFAYEKDFVPYRFSASSWITGEVVFAGYGISAPDLGYDDYEGLKVTGKIVVVLSHEPQETDPKSVFDGAKMTPHAEPYAKGLLAQKQGAAALLIVPNPAHHRKDPLVVKNLTAWPPPQDTKTDLTIPVIRCSPQVIGEVFRTIKKDLGRLQDKIDKALKPVTVKVKKVQISLRVSRRPDVMGVGRNVLGIWEGTDKTLKKECVILGAHYDHIGLGNFASRGKPGEVHNGANDNASGTAGVMILARIFTVRKIRMRRTLVFVAFDGEEKGLLGSKHYVKQPLFPLDKTAAMLNMDMIGRGPTHKIKVGGGTLNKTLNGILTRISGRFRMGLDLKGLDRFLRNSDQAPFMDVGIPCIFLSSGLFPGLHSEDDDAHLMNQTKLQSIVRTMMLVSVEVANLRQWK